MVQNICSNLRLIFCIIDKGENFRHYIGVGFDRLFDLPARGFVMGSLLKFATTVWTDIESLAITGVENDNHYVVVEIHCSLCDGVLASMSAAMYRVLRTELSEHNDTCEKCLNGDDIREARGEEPIRKDYDLTPERLYLPSPTHPKAFFPDAS